MHEKPITVPASDSCAFATAIFTRRQSGSSGTANADRSARTSEYDSIRLAVLAYFQAKSKSASSCSAGARRVTLLDFAGFDACVSGVCTNRAAQFITEDVRRPPAFDHRKQTQILFAAECFTCTAIVGATTHSVKSCPLCSPRIERAVEMPSDSPERGNGVASQRGAVRFSRVFSPSATHKDCCA